MGMFKWRVDSPSKLEYFCQKFNIPTNTHLRLAKENDSTIPRENYMPFLVVSIIKGGIRFLLDILFREVLHFYRLNPMQLATNTLGLSTGPKRVKKAKAKVTTFASDEERDEEDSVPISRLVEAEKRAAMWDSSEALPAKKPRCGQIIAKAVENQADVVAKAARAASKVAEDRAADAKVALKEALETKKVEIKQTGRALPPSPVQSEEEEEEEEQEEKANADATATGTKSLILNDHVLDLTEDDGDEVSKSISSKNAEVAAAKKSLNETLKEIDEEIAVEVKNVAEQADDDVLEPST
ncbi:resistance to inhibitors of cholinesterase protein 3-like [Camellia sinensis]|uniref:resistance to inhibitors of cholinesterase protein 3-like n=1 Tax=Camellia sinensis TaxID=4442 RepID=UPI001035B34B|nr:resistance to inhibitors of cholinesterase protein 3-like [Camellia sinensis]